MVGLSASPLSAAFPARTERSRGPVNGVKVGIFFRSVNYGFSPLDTALGEVERTSQSKALWSENRIWCRPFTKRHQTPRSQSMCTERRPNVVK
jgi:hypothetical protein